MTQLYKLTQEMENLLESDEVSETELERVFGDIQAKTGSICRFIRVVESDIETYKAEEKRIADRRKAMENHVKRLKDYLKENMVRLGLDKLKGDVFTIALQNSPPSLVIEDGAEIPADCIIVIPQHTEIDKTKVKDKLKAGEEINGAYLVQDQHVRIR